MITSEIIPIPLEECGTSANIEKWIVPTHFIYQDAEAVGACDRFSEPGTFGRLHHSLREAAAAADVSQMIQQAVELLYNARYARQSPIPTELYAFAFADLAVTGRRAYANLSEIEDLEDLAGDVFLHVREIFPAAPEAEIRLCTDEVFQRIHQVAWCLRGPIGFHRRHRQDLNWITVSGEDDPPHRPVNVDVSNYIQSDLRVEVPWGADDEAIVIDTRFVVANRYSDPRPLAERPASMPEDLAAGEVPLTDEIIVFIHGHSSRAEEMNDIAPQLLSAGTAAGKNYTVIAMDLPCCGYSSMLDSTRIAPTDASRPADLDALRRQGLPILDFLEEFICQFIETLGIQDLVAAVIGGSLGGNMSLRLGRRSPESYPYLHTVIPWSAASVWDSYLDPHDPLIDFTAKTLGLNTTEENSREIELDETRTTLGEDEEDSRRKYFREVFIDLPLDLIVYRIRRQPDHWYHDDWQPCKQLSIEHALLDRQEIYNPFFRNMHWRIAMEQLIYSQNLVIVGIPLYRRNVSRTLLLAGSGDDFDFTNIYSATATLARNMPEDIGRCILVRFTGHSIHNERPIWFATEIVRFLTE